MSGHFAAMAVASWVVIGCSLVLMYREPMIMGIVLTAVLTIVYCLRALFGSPP